MKAELVELIGKEYTLRVLFALRGKGPKRFSELGGELGANPAQLNRALKWLQERLYIVAMTVPRKSGPIRVTYDIGKRGSAFLDAFDSFVQGADKRREALGERLVQELVMLAE